MEPDHSTTKHSLRGLDFPKCPTCDGTGIILDSDDPNSPEYGCPDCGFDEDESGD